MRLVGIQCAAFLGVLVGWVLAADGQEFSDILQTQAETTPQGAMQNQPTAQTPQTPQNAPFSQDTTSRTFSSGLRRPSSRMYDAPNMFGDFFSPPGCTQFVSNTQLLFLNPQQTATLDPVALQMLQQQLSQDATNQALIQAQMEADRFQQQLDDFFNSEGTTPLPDFVIDPAAININVVLPDLNGAIQQPRLQPVFIQVSGMMNQQLAGGTNRTKIIENNHSLPQDRVYLLYNHFHNAITTDEFALPTADANGITTNLNVFARRRIQSLNRYTLGFEKTFEGGQSSAEFRLPLIGDLENPGGFDSQSQGGNVGNFSMILKRLFFTTDDFAVAMGLGINLPTGSDATGRVGDVGYEVNNEAVYFLPFVGVAGSPLDDAFYQAFAQLDIAGWGNPTQISDFRGSREIGTINDQTLLFLDATSGVWLYRNPNSRLAGLASILELHYTTTLQDADLVGTVAGRYNSLLVFGNCLNQLDILNGTVGLHTVLQNGTTIRVGGVFPLQNGEDNRLFDAEVQAAVNVPF